MNFVHKENLNGILRYFYNQRKDYYTGSFIKITSDQSDYQSGKDLKNVFDFDSTGYWIGVHTMKPHYLSFCLTNGYFALKGVELKSTSYSCRASKWAFAVSNNAIKWNGVKQYEQNINNAPVYFEYKKSPSRCFQIELIASTCNSVVFDLSQIELYGTLYDSYPTTNIRKCINIVMFFHALLLNKSL